ncbi:MAG: hypothetical protein ABI540_03260 [Spartobacteria bacterium]
MKKQLIVSFCVALATGLSSITAAEMMKADLGKTLSDASASAKAKMEAIDSYVKEVEKSASSYTRKEGEIAADSVKKFTDETWSKMHGYFDGEELKRMKLYPAAGSQKTEEFYYYDGEPVFVFLEKNGAGKENHDQNAVGTKYYFADGKLVEAMGPDGKSLDVKSEKEQAMGAKLMKESAAFRGMLK